MATGLFLITGCTGQTGESTATPDPDIPGVDCVSQDTGTTGVTEPTDASADESIEVIEYGYTPIRIDGHIHVTYGATIRNNSNLLAVDVQAEIIGLVGDEERSFYPIDIPYLMPGETHGLVAYSHFNAENGHEFDSIEVEFEAQEWWETPNNAYIWHDVSTFDAHFSDEEVPDPSFTGFNGDVIRFSAYSCFPDPRMISSVAVIRDSNGDIVGGTANRTETLQCAKDDTLVRSNLVPEGPTEYCLLEIANPFEGLRFLFDLENDVTPEVYVYIDIDAEPYVK